MQTRARSKADKHRIALRRMVMDALRTMPGPPDETARLEFLDHVAGALLDRLPRQVRDSVTGLRRSAGTATGRIFGRLLSPDSNPGGERSPQRPSFALSSIDLEPADLGDVLQHLMHHCPDNRRGKGSFYTPPAIAAGLVRLACRRRFTIPCPIPETPAVSLRVLDPACGAGVFLLAFTEWMAENRMGGAPLSLPVWTHIYRDNLYGRDIDPEALKTCRKALLIDFLRRTECHHIDIIEEVARGLLENIVRRNFLAAPETPETAIRKNGNGEPLTGDSLAAGMDLILGNPPFLSSFSRFSSQLPESEKTQLRQRFSTLRGRVGTVAPFLEQGVACLNDTGVLVYLVPRSIFMMMSYAGLREWLLGSGLRHIGYIDRNAFPAVTMATGFVVVQKPGSPSAPKPAGIAVSWMDVSGNPASGRTLEMKEILTGENCRFLGHLAEDEWALIQHLYKHGCRLETYALVEDGINPGPFRERLIVRGARPSPEFLPLLEGKDIQPFMPPVCSDLWFRWSPDEVQKWQKDHPNSRAVLGDLERFHAPKIVVRQTAAELCASLDTAGCLCTNSVHTIRLKPSPGPAFSLGIILAVLNSSLARFFCQMNWREKGDAFPQIKIGALRAFPLPIPVPENREILNELEDLVGKCLCGRLPVPPPETIRRRIDDLVLALYHIPPHLVRVIHANQPLS